MVRRGVLVYQQEFGLLHYITEEKIRKLITPDRLLMFLESVYGVCQRKKIAENYLSHLISLSFKHKHTHAYTSWVALIRTVTLKFTNLNHSQRWPKVAFLCITNGHLPRDSYFSTMMRGNKSNSNHWHFLDEGSVLHRSWGPSCPAPLSLWQRQMRYVIYSFVRVCF